MEYFLQILLLGWMGILARQDQMEKSVKLTSLLGAGVTGAAAHIVTGAHSWHSVWAGICIGGMLILFSVLSGGKIGLGDGIVFVISSFYLGVYKNLELLIGSVFLAGIFALGLKVICGKKRSESFAFLPCVMAAQSGMLFLSCVDYLISGSSGK